MILFSVFCCGLEVCDGCAGTDKMDSSATGLGSSGAKGGLEDSSTRQVCLVPTGACHLLWPPLSFLCLDKEMDPVRV